MLNTRRQLQVNIRQPSQTEKDKEEEEGIFMVLYHQVTVVEEKKNISKYGLMTFLMTCGLEVKPII